MNLATALQLREQAKSFQSAALKLLEAAAILDGNDIEAAPSDKPLKAKRKYTRRKFTKRQKQVREFLASGTGAKWAEILAGTKIPKGTLASLLREGSGFHKDEDGKWHVIPEVKDEEVM